MPNNESYTKCYDLITKKEFIELCILLSNEFNNYYNTNEYVFTPEAISEGGILFKNFNDGNKYKTMILRIILDNGYYYRNGYSGMESFYTVWINGKIMKIYYVIKTRL